MVEFVKADIGDYCFCDKDETITKRIRRIFGRVCGVGDAHDFAQITFAKSYILRLSV